MESNCKCILVKRYLGVDHGVYKDLVCSYFFLGFKFHTTKLNVMNTECVVIVSTWFELPFL